MPLFEVQTVDPQSGAESWTLVSASTVEKAREQVLATGMVIGAVRLRSLDEPNVPTTRTPIVTPATARGSGMDQQEADRLLRLHEQRVRQKQTEGALIGLLVIVLIPIVAVLIYALLDR